MAKNQNLQPALDAAQNQLSLTFSASDSLDSKALGLIAYDVAIGIFTLQSQMHNQWYLLVLLFAALSVSLIICIISILPQDYRGALVDLDQHPDYFKLDEQMLISQLLADTQEAIIVNTGKNNLKSRYSLISIISGSAATVLLIGCII